MHQKRYSDIKKIYLLCKKHVLMNRLFIIFLVISCFACGRNTNNQANNTTANSFDSINPPVIHFYSDTLNLGDIKEGEKLNCTFRFKNEGKSDLVITYVTAGCGCTSTEWDHEPIKPGKESEIKIVFNSKGRSGKQVKSVFVNSNAQKEEKVLKFTCFVISSNKS